MTASLHDAFVLLRNMIANHLPTTIAEDFFRALRAVEQELRHDASMTRRKAEDAEVAIERVRSEVAGLRALVRALEERLDCNGIPAPQ